MVEAPQAAAPAADGTGAVALPAAAAPAASVPAAPAVVAPAVVAPMVVAPDGGANPGALTGALAGAVPGVVPPVMPGTLPGAAPVDIPGLEALPGGMASIGPAIVAPPPKVLVLGDENFLFTSGLQEAYPNSEFTSASALSRQNLEVYNFDPCPAALKGRMRYMVDPVRIGKHFKQHEFDALVLFLPGLSYLVPPELGTADRPLFAYRTHLFAFHVIRHAKLVLKNEAKLHLVWPEETGLMTSPCGAAGIEMPNLMTFCGCRSIDPEFAYDKVEEGWFMPFIFGEVPQETPEWLTSLQMFSYTVDKHPIPVPLSVALLLHPDIGFVSIKDPSTEPTAPPGPGSPLRACLVHEAFARRKRLKEIFGPKQQSEDATTDAYGLVSEPLDEDSLLSIPMEIFMTSFDDIPHISHMLKFQVIDDQPAVSVATLDMLDPRLPTRIARPPPPKSQIQPPGAINASTAAKKRPRPDEEEWGGMKFHCPLTKICTLTADRMRLHMQGDLYKKRAFATPGWEESAEKKMLIEMLNEAEQLEQQQLRARKAINAANAAVAAGMSRGKGRGKGK